ncbi:tectonic-1 isoform X2 [Larimichthys crocea]|uniref:tectonic-1 isoform X2 n=1 Tax=Larimichthys crocea TaxID=215358 RepID=UPI000F601476|nr:tectonic-1 isoform X2 [Larimichthys crocea]
MAASAVVLWSTLSFSLFLWFSAATAEENTTSYSLSTAVYGDQNVTYNGTDSSTQPAEFESTTPTAAPSSSSTERPVQPTLSADPLPVSGQLPTPATSVDRLCPCDAHRDVCDINCCCDRACREEVALFTGCSLHSVSGNKQLCSRDVASYSLGITIDGYSELQSSVQKETNYDVFCIQSQSGADGFSHPSPALPTDSNFDSLFKQFTSFIFGSEESSGQVLSAELQGGSGYQYGDVMMTAGGRGHRGMFFLPAPGVTAYCMDTSAAAFLKDQSSQCSRHMVLEQDCSTLPALSMDTYTNIQLFAGKENDAAEVVPVEVTSVILQSVDGTQTELQISDGEHLSPVLLNPTLCANVVLKVVYVMKYNPAGEIVKVMVSLVLGFVREAVLILDQEFQITFVQDGEEVAVHYSGNPGYVVGLPLVSGTRTADGITRSIDPRDTLSLLHTAGDQDCLQGLHKRSPVLFSVDSVSGCKLRLEDAANCSLVFQALLDVLRGPNYPQYVASFGNSPLEYPLDWVPIKNNSNPGEAQSCIIPLSLHLEIEWTKYGSLVNPQAQIVSVKEVIQTNVTSLDQLSGGSNTVSITSSVAFIPVSAAALPGYRAMPTIDAKLPFDFFFPFV